MLPKELEPSPAYLLAGIVYLPHYTQPNTFVGPGGREFSVEYLRNFGAEKLILPLWPRAHRS